MTPKVWASEDRSQPVPKEEQGPGGGRPTNGFTRDELEKIITDKGGRGSILASRSYARQYLSDPLAGEAARLSKDFIQWYEGTAVEIGARCNIYVTQDPSPGLSDPTWTWVWGLHPDGNYYWLDGWRRRCSPGKRLAETYLTALKWNGIGNLIELRIESYGQGGYAEAQAEHFGQMGLEIKVQKVADSHTSKREREFESWEPPLHEGRIFFPKSMIREGEVGEPIDLVRYFIDKEMSLYPLPSTDDGLDAGGLLWARESTVGGPLQWPQKRERKVFEDMPNSDDAEVGAMAGGIL